MAALIFSELSGKSLSYTQNSALKGQKLKRVYHTTDYYESANTLLIAAIR